MARADGKSVSLLLVEGATHDPVDACLQSGDQWIAFRRKNGLVASRV